MQLPWPYGRLKLTSHAIHCTLCLYYLTRNTNYIPLSESCPFKLKIAMTDRDSPTILHIAARFFRSNRQHLFGWSLNTAMCCFIAARGAPPLWPSLAAVISTAFLTFSVYVYNDILDAGQDRQSPIKKERPIPTGEASEKVARALTCVTAFIGLMIVLFVNKYSFLFAFIGWFLSMIYSHRGVFLKSRFIIKELTVTLALPATGLVGVYAATGAFSLEAFMAMLVWSFFLFLAQPVVTDAVDVEQDRWAGVQTLATRTNWNTRILLLLIGVTGVLVSVPVIYVYLDFNLLLPGIGIPVTLAFLVYLLLTRQGIKDNPVRARNISLLFFIILQLAFVFGSLRI